MQLLIYLIFIIMKGIYIIKFENGTEYIGRSINIEKRIRSHKYQLNNNIHKNIYLQNVYNKYRELKWELLEECDYDIQGEKEKYWINELSPKLNMTEGGDGGEILTEEAKKYRKNIYTEGYREKMSEKMKSLDISKEKLLERGKKISESRKKLYQNPEEKERLISVSNIRNSNGHKNQKKGGESPIAKKVINIITGEIYNSLKDVAISNKLNYSSLINRLRERKGPNTTPYRYL